LSRLLALGGGLLLLSLVFSLSREAEEGGPALTRAPPPWDPTAPAPGTFDPLPPPPPRDIFRYAEAAAPPASPGGRPKRAAAEAPLAPPLAQPPPAAVRLVGLVRKPGGLRAAVSTSGGVVIVGPGDTVEGHTVLGIDEDRGLRLRAPDGSEQSLAPGG